MRLGVVNLIVTCALGLGVPLSSSNTVVAGDVAAQPAAGAFATAADQMFSADEVTLRFREVGTGDPVLLIHGYTAALESQAGIANTLANTNRVVELDNTRATLADKLTA